MTTDRSTMHSRVIPVFGARKFARQLLIEIDELRSEREVAEAKTQRLSEIAHNLVADAKATRVHDMFTSSLILAHSEKA
jgi:hypothetical protein